MELTNHPSSPPAMVADWAAQLMLKSVAPPRNTNGSGPRTVINGRMPNWVQRRHRHPGWRARGRGRHQVQGPR